MNYKKRELLSRIVFAIRNVYFLEFINLLIVLVDFSLSFSLSLVSSDIYFVGIGSLRFRWISKAGNQKIEVPIVKNVKNSRSYCGSKSDSPPIFDPDSENEK